MIKLSITCIQILRITVSDGPWVHCSLKFVSFSCHLGSEFSVLGLTKRHRPCGHACFSYPWRFGWLIFIGTVSSRADHDAVAWTDQVMQSPGGLWVHDWDTPECVSQMRTSFRHQQRWMKGCLAAVCLYSHTHTDTRSFPVTQCMYLVHLVLQEMFNVSS